MVKDGRGRTPLEVAASLGHTKIEMLLKSVEGKRISSAPEVGLQYDSDLDNSPLLSAGVTFVSGNQNAGSTEARN